MPFSIKNEEADRLVLELAKATGEGLTKAVTKALRERLQRVKAGRRRGRSPTNWTRSPAVVPRCR